jgi:hypothetical protein
VQPTALSLRFSTLCNAQRRLGLERGSRRAAADAGRWAGGFLGVRLQFVCSAHASTSNAQEPSCPSKQRRSSALVDPPSRSCQPPLPLHPRRVCFAAGAHRASPPASRLGTAIISPCLPVCLHGKGVALGGAARQVATPAAPPNTCCSRPPCRCVFPPQCEPTARAGSHCFPRRAAAERHRWAAPMKPHSVSTGLLQK